MKETPLNTENALIIFVKNLLAGRTKTRLANTLGDEQALLIYRELLNHTRSCCVNVSAAKYVFYSQFIDQNDQWSPDHFKKRKQYGDDLGDRMIHAFNNVFSAHSKAILIGSDCPQLTSKIIDRGIEILDKEDVVIGPSLDGGYYLIGMKTAHPFLFSGIAWSTDKVFEDTLERARSKELSVGLLPVLSDVDTEEDWIKYGWKFDI